MFKAIIVRSSQGLKSEEIEVSVLWSRICSSMRVFIFRISLLTDAIAAIRLFILALHAS